MGSQPHVAVLAALAGAEAGMGLPPVVSTAQRARVVGAGLGWRIGWLDRVVVVRRRVVVVHPTGRRGRERPVVATGEEVHPLLQRLGVLVRRAADPVGQVQDWRDAQPGVGEQVGQLLESEGTEVLDPSHAAAVVVVGPVRPPAGARAAAGGCPCGTQGRGAQVDVEGGRGSQRRQVVTRAGRRAGRGGRRSRGSAPRAPPVRRARARTAQQAGPRRARRSRRRCAREAAQAARRDGRASRRPPNAARRLRGRDGRAR